jgi:hypothetical protein
MTYKVVLTIALWFSITAVASAGCYGIGEVQIPCQGSDGCQSSYAYDYCIPGTWGSFCATNYGSCCGNDYDTHSAEGSCYCTGYGCDAKKSPKSNDLFLVEDTLSLASSARRPVLRARADAMRAVEISAVRNLMLSQMMFIPDKCDGSFRAVVPD